ncbi:gliding motility-associated C-terminal domain-containing protein [Pricia antarctica]|uniref:Gliding motility-associated C-terminal domain-containing protein n=1 Tax=Pricia antarctica TaxID=641691 RepID=A0A1G7A686_9FLAO|nr:T9SS type B sorting domain-containing protein [Pricia antarctica]SDE10281.1 gliding motility-associated C-terminal domain-containing protein [Pricia antarctica]
MRPSRFLITITVFLLVQCSFAQREASRWYFGNGAGLDFNSGVPVALTDGQLNTHEGCSTLSDQNGNLLFYSNGIEVWDKAHRLMPNGTGLLGHESSTQSAIIIPKEGSKTQYYLFTVDEPDPEESVNYGLNYTLIDLSLHNGFGDVVTSEKNMPLITYNQSDPAETLLKCSEKITAVQHNDERSIWVITHFRDTFYAFEVDENGVNTTPVTSKTNTIVPTGGYKQNGIGYLKVSPDGKKIGVAHSQVSSSNYAGPKLPGIQTGKVLLYDFDANTGRVSNELTLMSNSVPYGIEFSPKSTKLYTTVNNYENDGRPLGSSLYQFDLSASNIIKSKEVISKSTNVAGGLQLAIDGKIYRAGYPVSGFGFNISVIENPELKGALCNFKQNTVSLDGKAAELGLPPYVQSFFLLKFEFTNVCYGDATEFMITGDAPFDSVAWDFGDGTTSTETSPKHTFDAPGDYTVSLIRYAGGVASDPVSKDINIYDAPQVPAEMAEYFQCNEDPNKNGIGIFNLNQINTTVSLDTDQIINVFYYKDLISAEEDTTNANALAFQYTNTKPDEILVAKVVNPISGCQSYAEVQLKMKLSARLDIANMKGCDLGDGKGEFHFDLKREAISNELNLSESSSIRFYTSENKAKVGTEDYLPDTYISGSETIYVRIDHENSCYGSGKFDLEIEAFAVAANQEVLLCGSENYGTTLTAGIDVGPEDKNTYLWSTGASTSTISIKESGNYSVMVTNAIGCTSESLISVIETELPEIENIAVTNNRLEVFMTGSGPYEYTINDKDGTYQESPIFQNLPSGIVTVFARNKDGCGITSRQVSIIAYPKFFTPNGDQVNDYWQLDGLSSEFDLQSPIFIFDRFGSLLAQIDPVSSGWDGNFKGRPLVSSDYWFSVALDNGRTLRGHFTLKR